jgi:hypothetical protein
MPCLRPRRSVFSHHRYNAIDLMRAKAPAPRHLKAAEPDLDRRLAPVDVDMRRLVRFVALEVDPKRADPHDRRHGY